MEQYSPSKNSLIPIGLQNSMNSALKNAKNSFTTVANSVSQPSNWFGESGWMVGVAFFAIVVFLVVFLLRFYSNQISDGISNFNEWVRSKLGYSSQPKVQTLDKPIPVTKAPTPPSMEESNPSDLVEKILPTGSPQVYNVSKNTFTYYDAEPLCKAMGAELATYDQVKSAWERGADWCNYGWVKGQMAVYPTQKETWEKLQAGPEEQRMACGNPGLNGGYFDNPEMRFGVNCYGPKPSQSKHDANVLGKGAPLSPGALEFDRKVAKYRSESDSLGVLPFNNEKWNT